jgi:hypothetical protein
MTEDMTLKVWVMEYDKLKAEQTQRIGFRDNLLYVTLTLFGGIISLSVSNTANYYALLVIPWICVILGWTYLVNDEKISAIGRYIRYTLTDKIKERIGQSDTDVLLGWEVAHRSDPRRGRRKIEQLIIDEITFVISGIAALTAFGILVPNISPIVLVLVGFEIVLLLILGCEIFTYADLKKGR